MIDLDDCPVCRAAVHSLDVEANVDMVNRHWEEHPDHREAFEAERQAWAGPTWTSNMSGAA